VSGCWELNPVYMLPKHAYYRYTTARIGYRKSDFGFRISNSNPISDIRLRKSEIVPRARIGLATQRFSVACSTTELPRLCRRSDIGIRISDRLSDIRIPISEIRDVAGAGFEPATSRLWAWRAANCSTPRYSDLKIRENREEIIKNSYLFSLI
jgi:hypothetical protein